MSTVFLKNGSFSLLFCWLISIQYYFCLILSNNNNWENEFEYHIYLNEHKTYQLFWTHIDNETIEIGISVQTNGWIGMGLSQNGQMVNSDIIVGWVDDNTGIPYLQDRHTGSRRREPSIDVNQSLSLIYGDQVNGTTRLRFTRPKVLCNEEGI